MNFVVRRTELVPGQVWSKAKKFVINIQQYNDRHGFTSANEQNSSADVKQLYSDAMNKLTKLAKKLGTKDEDKEFKGDTKFEEKVSVSDVIVERKKIYLISSEGHEFAVDKRIAASSTLLKQMLGYVEEDHNAALLKRLNRVGSRFHLKEDEDDDDDEDDEEDDDEDDEEEDGDEPHIPLPIETSALAAIVRFCHFHLKNGAIDLNGAQTNHWLDEYQMVTTWDADFINEIYDSGDFVKLVDTAFYLQIPSLIMLIGIKMESMMRKDPNLRSKLVEVETLNLQLYADAESKTVQGTLHPTLNFDHWLEVEEDFKEEMW